MNDAVGGDDQAANDRIAAFAAGLVLEARKAELMANPDDPLALQVQSALGTDAGRAMQIESHEMMISMWSEFVESRLSDVASFQFLYNLHRPCWDSAQRALHATLPEGETCAYCREREIRECVLLTYFTTISENLDGVDTAAYANASIAYYGSLKERCAHRIAKHSGP